MDAQDEAVATFILELKVTHFEVEDLNQRATYKSFSYSSANLDIKSTDLTKLDALTSPPPIPIPGWKCFS